MAEKAILYDATRCTACRGCQALCKEWNENDEVIPAVQGGVKEKNWGSYENPKDLSTRTWLKIGFNEVEHYNRLDWLFSRRSCMHCTNAVCIKVCPTGALYRDEVYGIVGLNRNLCSGCGYCVDFCPFDVPRLDGNRLIGKGVMSKCVLCTQAGLNRLDINQEPACVKTCPTDALTFGDRDTLVATARQKVAALKAKGLTNATFYGEKELGGLHVLYVLNDTPDKYGLPVDPQFPATATAWQDIIQPLGWAVGGLTLLGLAFNFVIAREAKMTKELPGKSKGGKKHVTK
jgi:formate dehydrogenase iron-sulfur subunit